MPEIERKRTQAFEPLHLPICHTLYTIHCTLYTIHYTIYMHNIITLLKNECQIYVFDFQETLAARRPDDCHWDKGFQEARHWSFGIWYFQTLVIWYFLLAPTSRPDRQKHTELDGTICSDIHQHSASLSSSKVCLILSLFLS